jgi:hypothetical protein
VNDIRTLEEIHQLSHVAIATLGLTADTLEDVYRKLIQEEGNAWLSDMHNTAVEVDGHT